MNANLRWPIGIAAILATSVIANIAVMRIAGSDPSFAVEPEYYRKAVAFDSTIAQGERNRQLGWSATAAIAATPGGATISVGIRDSLGIALRDVAVSAVAIFVARAAEPDSLNLTVQEDGTYAAPLKRMHAGLWEIRVRATRGADRFETTLRTEASAFVAAAPAR